MTTHPADRTLIETLARQTMAYPFKVWGFGEGIALEALWEAADALGDDSYRQFVRDLFERWLARPIAEPDHSAPGMLLLDAYEFTGDARYLERARELAAHMLALPHDEATGAALHRPQHPDYHDYLYVDCMEVDAPFVCKLGRVTGDAAFTEAGVAQILAYCALLQDDETGLFHHQYNRATGQVNGAFWGRGNGWALLGMLKTLRLLPDTDPAHAAITARFVRLVSALDCWQRPDGTWSTVINATETYRECSLPALFGAGIGLGIRHGLLDASFAPVVERAWRATYKRINDGLLRDVSIATPPGDAAHYDQIATGAGYPWGQGPALLFALMQGSISAR